MGRDSRDGGRNDGENGGDPGRGGDCSRGQAKDHLGGEGGQWWRSRAEILVEEIAEESVVDFVAEEEEDTRVKIGEEEEEYACRVGANRRWSWRRRRSRKQKAG